MIPSLILLGLLALGLAAALALFVSVKQELRRQARANHARVEQILRRLSEIPKNDTPAPEDTEPPPLAPLRSGMNMNKRIQAVRLLRRGEDIGHVAAALGVPRCEVELLVRVQEFSAQRAAGAG